MWQGFPKNFIEVAIISSIGLWLTKKDPMKNLFVKYCRWIEIPLIKDGFDGIISVAHYNRDIPFTIKRVYYIYNLMKHEQVCRGKHAHKQLEQVLFCINGSCNVELDDGFKKQVVEIACPHIGIYLGTKLWHTMYNFANNCILLVFASDIYRESDYIRDYDTFLTYAHNIEVSSSRVSYTIH